VFVPAKIMFGEEYKEVPIVQISIDGSLKPEKEVALGKALADLRFGFSLSLSR
jgi:aromatic ring-opening dioxygenase catalytic subunit (LigB family)